MELQNEHLKKCKELTNVQNEYELVNSVYEQLKVQNEKNE